jgi:hypothetical protein
MRVVLSARCVALRYTGLGQWLFDRLAGRGYLNTGAEVDDMGDY